MASGNGSDHHELERFIEAQRDVYDTALNELRRGKKESHWIWFIFPQLAGLGRSEISRFYGVRNIDEARKYWQHPILGSRLRECIRAVLEHREKSARSILGDIDSTKFQSCLTLFQAVAGDEEGKKLIGDALTQFYENNADKLTLDLLNNATQKR